MHINEGIKKAHSTAVEKGFWDQPNWNLGEKLMLITSELGEALEADRTGKKANPEKYNQDLKLLGDAGPLFREENLKKIVESFKANIKDSFEDELADAVIRIFDLAGKMNINLEYHIQAKMDFNSTRDRLHGKKY